VPPLPLDKSPELDALRSAHAQLRAVLGSGPPRPLPLWAAAPDLEQRGQHFRELLRAVRAYVQALLGDVALNIPRELDLSSIEALSCDLQSEVAGVMQLAATSLDRGRHS